MQGVACKNDNSAYLHFLIMSHDTYFLFIVCLNLSMQRLENLVFMVIPHLVVFCVEIPVSKQVECGI